MEQLAVPSTKSSSYEDDDSHDFPLHLHNSVSQMKSGIYILLCLREGAFNELLVCFCFISSVSELIPPCDTKLEHCSLSTHQRPQV